MPDQILEKFEQAGAYLLGHFLLTSGRHSDVYFEKFMLLQHPVILGELLARLALPLRDQKIATVVGPTLGGAVIAFELARQLGIRAVYAEADDDKRILRRGLSLAAGERVVICDDILTTGRSVREVIAMAEEYAAEIVAIVLFLDRSGGETTFDYPLQTLASVKANAWLPEECPLCGDGVPITKRGSRKSVG